MIDLSTLLQELKPEGEYHSIVVTDDWLQGRTVYGGLAAAICVESALRHISDLPPLRSAQFSFVGPASGHLTARPTVLRRGKSTTFVAVDLRGEAGLATRATLCFGAARRSVLTHETLAAPDVPNWDKCPSFFGEKPVITFAQHFDGRLAAGGYPMDGSSDPNMLLWLRHRGSAPNTVSGLIALADAPPPAAMVMFKQYAPISTMTWSIDLLAEQAESRNGWWLVSSSADKVMDGYSSQSMIVWNADGNPVAVSRQNIAIFT